MRDADDVIYADELGEETTLTFTRRPPGGWTGHTGRIDADMVAAAVGELSPELAFVCGSHGFVEAATQLLLAAGLEGDRIRTERFGPTGLP